MASDPIDLYERYHDSLIHSESGSPKAVHTTQGFENIALKFHMERLAVHDDAVHIKDNAFQFHFQISMNV